jgi:hypothetical protein
MANEFETVFQKVREYRSELSWKDSSNKASFEVRLPDPVQIEQDEVEELRQLAMQMAEQDSTVFTTT